MLCLQGRLLLYAGEIKLSNKVEASDDEAILDIDCKHKDHRMCSVYAAEVYSNLRVTEVCLAVNLPLLFITTFYNFYVHGPHGNQSNIFITCDYVRFILNYIISFSFYHVYYSLV